MAKVFSRIPLPSYPLFVASIRFPPFLSSLFVAVVYTRSHHPHPIQSNFIALISFIYVLIHSISITFTSLICDINSHSIALIPIFIFVHIWHLVESHRCAAFCRLSSLQLHLISLNRISWDKRSVERALYWGFCSSTDPQLHVLNKFSMLSFYTILEVISLCGIVCCWQVQHSFSFQKKTCRFGCIAA